jgi:hypothetical protein
MSRVTVMDPLGGPGEAKGLRRLRYLIVTAPRALDGPADAPTPEQDAVNAVVSWVKDGNEVLAFPHGTVVLAIDPDTGACLWSTGTVPGAAAEGGAP